MSFRVVVLISGRGTNLQALIDAAESYAVIGVVCDRPDALGLRIASDNDIPYSVVARRDFSSRVEQRAALDRVCDQFSPDLLCLAGFMQILEANFVEKHSDTLVNIHPSLLPKFPGLDTHARALAAQEKYHGATVHFVDTVVDAGPIIAQASTPIALTDSEDSLAARVLTLEHELYPWCVNRIAEGMVWRDGGTTKFHQSLKIPSHFRTFPISESSE